MSTTRLKLYNTLTRKVEDFKPISPPSPRSAGQVGMYTCGPTVYDYMHIGNLRTFVLSDLLRRVLTFNGYTVRLVENITDIDDKIIKRAKEKRLGIEGIAREYTKYFLEDTMSLNILPPTVQPAATQHLGKMIKYIDALIERGLAYKEKDGSVYFDISKFPSYGRLARIDKNKLKSGTRILSDEYTKDDVQDFALWKAVGPDEVGWSSVWGRGRPGWHIECSVMSQEYLGDGEPDRTIDIHLGGMDLIFPHHENEIAQSEGKTGKKFVNYFVHGAHMLVDGQKMSKSLANFYTLRDVVARGFNPLSLRYLYLQTHYRQEMNFTWEALSSAQNALNNLVEEVSSWDKPEIGCAEFEQKFADSINNDLNMPEALAVMWELVKTEKYPTSARAQSLLKMDEVLGLNLAQSVKLKAQKEETPEEVTKMVQEREELRRQKRFHLADQLRNKIKKLGYLVEDTNGQSKVKRVE